MRDLPKFDISSFVLLNDRQPIASGGGGQIFEVTPSRKLSPKILLGVSYFIKIPLSEAPIEKPGVFKRHLEEIYKRTERKTAYFESRCALPIAIVERGGKYLGFLMVKFDKGCFFTKTYGNGETGVVLQELQNFLNRPEERNFFSVPRLNLLARLEILADYLETTNQVHEHGLVIGDISGKNIVLQNKPSRNYSYRALVLDIDSFRSVGYKHPLGSQFTQDWMSPEELADHEFMSNKATDVYKAALLATRLLHQAGTDTGSSFDIYASDVAADLLSEIGASETRDLIKAALDPDPTLRPPAAQLSRSFKQLVKAKSGGLEDYEAR